jgi:hypothetical protein
LASGARDEFLTELKTLFGIDIRDLADGFSYLGYHIKPTSYNARDWRWLIEKFEFRILHWCNRCLTLGGRYILIKAVLESLPVYWMALAHIPLSVIKKIRSVDFCLPLEWQQAEQRLPSLWVGDPIKTKIAGRLGNEKFIPFSTKHSRRIRFGEF